MTVYISYSATVAPQGPACQGGSGACVALFSIYMLAASVKLGLGKIATTFDFDTVHIARNF